MLNITRKEGERLRLSGVLLPGESIEVAVVEIRGKSVRLGVAAPMSVAINRVTPDGPPPLKVPAPKGRP